MAHEKDAGKNNSGEGVAYIGIFSSIEAEVARELIDIIANDLPENTHTLYILFSSGGGSTAYGFVIYNFLRALPYKLIMHNIGSVDSIGLVIFLAAEERYAIGNATFLIHRVITTASNERADEGYMEEKLSCIRGEENKIRNVLLGRSSISPEDFDQLFTSGRLKDVDYAMKNGIIHEVRDFKMPPSTPISVIKSDKPKR